jgi:hypothetical protein
LLNFPNWKFNRSFISDKSIKKINSKDSLYNLIMSAYQAIENKDYRQFFVNKNIVNRFVTKNKFCRSEIISIITDDSSL